MTLKGPGNLTNWPILIVEDSDEDFEVCSAAMEGDAEGQISITRCQTGDEAIDYINSAVAPDGGSLPRLILLDLNLPGQSGLDVLSRLKSDSRSQPVPVVIITSSDDTADIDACYRCGANSYVQKPVDFDGFFERVRRIRDFWFWVALIPE